ncbi:MAG TPA: hypothetical protein VGQ83_07450, partial [Polyangia bacterium]
MLLAATFGLAGTAWAQAVDPDDEDGDQGAVPAPPAPPEQAQPAPEQAQPAPVEPEPQWRYAGPHAINAEAGSGFCTVQGVHTHPYPPFDDRLFQEQNGSYYFLGDPVDFGYGGGSLYWYNAAHPIATGWGVGWCFIGFPHRHLYQPMGAFYSACGSYFCYTGPFDAWYWRWRPYYVGYWGAYYPRFYRGGAYYRTHVAASPGRWAHVGWRRPGGYARPLPGRGPVVGRGAPYSRLPHAGPAARPLAPSARPLAPSARPGMAHPGMMPRAHAAPTRLAPPARSAAPPRPMAPARPMAPPRTMAPQHITAPRP